jgi:hypothetical protein
MRTEGGERLHKSGALSYSDAIALGSRLDGAGARDVRLVEAEGPRPRSRVSPHRGRPAAAAQIDMFKRRKGRP